MENKLAKIIMLPTGKKMEIGIQEHWYTGSYLIHQEIEQHLYFTTNEEIKPGDYVLWGNIVTKAVVVEEKEVYVKYNALKTTRGLLRKIIATTDKSLTTLYTQDERQREVNGVLQVKSLPQPSQAFIKEYCDKGGIDEVMVWYTDGGEDSAPVITNNEITITPIKDSWTKGEISQIVHDCIYSRDDFRGGIEISTFPDGTVSEITGVKEWLNNNL